MKADKNYHKTYEQSHPKREQVWLNWPSGTRLGSGQSFMFATDVFFLISFQINQPGSTHGVDDFFFTFIQIYTNNCV